MAPPCLLRRVRLRNYKSIGKSDVRMAALSFLVGPNGSGKSNFLDALRFVADGLSTTLEYALRDRGGIAEVRRRSRGHPRHFAIRLDFDLPSGAGGYYAFSIGSKERFGFSVEREECVVDGPEPLRREWFRVERGEASGSPQTLPRASADRLFLVSASNLEEFRGVHDALSRMGFYNLNPAAIRDLQAPDAGALLARDGGNIASVVERLEARGPETLRRIEEFLEVIVPGMRSVRSQVIGPKQTVEFRHDVAGSPDPWRFTAANMSDGTLRALGVLVALFQVDEEGRPAAPLVGIEEPEAALHPAAAGALVEALREASASRQVIVTSHSPDLLDEVDVGREALLAVTATGGESLIAPIAEAEREALRTRLYTAGELLRMAQITPDPDELRRLPTNGQIGLFDLGREGAG
jgi:predicted ATPase